MPKRKVNGAVIREARTSTYTSVRDLVAALAEQGISVHEDSIRNIELGHKPCSAKLAHGIAVALEIPDYVLYLDASAAA
jgi:hypothetical protein